MSEKIHEMQDKVLISTYRSMLKLRTVNYRLYGGTDPWVDELIDELADEIGRREITFSDDC